MYACILDSTGAIVAHRNMPSAPAPLLAFIAPYRSDIIIGVECIFTWYWLADLCALHESHSRRQGQERQDRLAQDCSTPARWHVPASVCLSCHHACHP
jgi:hypothetical protein